MPLPAPPLTDAAVLVGFSGGLDSSVLLHLLAGDPARRRHGLRALHVHHGLHPDADHWATHCEAACRALDIPLQVVRVQVDRQSGRGPEAAARDARHAAFADALGTSEVLALAHHRDDQAETFLLRALRGSGVQGLGAMRPVRRFARGWLWRPLLDVPRRELLEHARRQGMHWIEDPSNADDALDRNFLRRQVLPLLATRWPHAEAMLARSATLAAEADDLLAEGDARALADAGTLDPAVLRIDALRPLPPARRARVLRAWIRTLGLPPLPGNGVDQLEALLQATRPDTDARFDWHGARIEHWRGLLRGGPITPPLPADFSIQWDGVDPLPLPDGGCLSLLGDARFDAPLQVHARRGGERIRLPGRTHSHALKQVLQDLGIPAWERRQLPVLSDHDGRVLAAGDVVFEDGFDVWLRARQTRLLWQSGATTTAATGQADSLDTEAGHRD